MHLVYIYISSKITEKSRTSYKESFPHVYQKLKNDIRFGFDDGFYIRWHHLTTNTPNMDQLKDNLTIINDHIHHYDDHIKSGQDNFDEFFNETFNEYCS